MLLELFHQVTQTLKPENLDHLLPPFKDRSFWENVPPVIQNEIIGKAEIYQNTAWPSLPAALFRDFFETGNRGRYEYPYFLRRRMMSTWALAEALEGQGRFLRDLGNALWSIFEESTWVLPAHIRQSTH